MIRSAVGSRNGRKGSIPLLIVQAEFLIGG